MRQLVEREPEAMSTISTIESSRVLIIEDDEAIAALIKRTLTDAAIECDVAHTGLDGLWKAREAQYGVICLDIMLPEMNGYEVCRTLRGEGIETPILMLTAKTGEYDASDGFDLGADDYVRKPFSPVVLVARVRSLMRRTSVPIASDVLERGAVALDITSGKCTVDGDEVTLTSRERKVLEALLRAGDGAISRDRLLQEVWGFDFDGDTNVVDVYIGYLRKKVGRSHIENRRGIGYRVAN